jgi:type I restriction enzyme S subunit
VQSGGTPKAGFIDKPGIPFLKVYNIVGQEIDFEYRPQFVSKNIHQSELKKSIALPGDVLMNIVGPPLGKVAIVPRTFPEWNANQAIAIFRPSDAAISRWIYYFLCGGTNVQSVINATRGSAGQVNISLSQRRNFELSLPPAAEQRRIVEKLDLLTARLARARAELDRIPVLVKKMKYQALKACFENSAPPQSELGSLLRGIESGKNMRCEERPPREDELGVVKVSAVTWGRFDPRQSKTLPPDYTPPEKARIRTGDLLISRANTLELVGAVVLVDHEPKGLFLSDKILRLVLDEDSKKWVLWYLRSPFGRKQIQNLATGNQLSMRNISQDVLRRIRLPFPSTEIRRHLIDKVEAIFSRADRLDAESTRCRALLDRLESAILAKAFKGELVPQDLNDKPASVLLDLIRAQRISTREAKPMPKSGRRITA